MAKGARIRKARREGTNRRNTLVTREENVFLMSNPANAEKAIRLANGQRKSSHEASEEKEKC